MVGMFQSKRFQRYGEQSQKYSNIVILVLFFEKNSISKLCMLQFSVFYMNLSIFTTWNFSTYFFKSLKDFLQLETEDACFEQATHLPYI